MQILWYRVTAEGVQDMQWMWKDESLYGSPKDYVKERLIHRSPQGSKSVHEVQQDEEPYTIEWENSDMSFHSVNMKYINSDHVKSEIFNKLKSWALAKRRAQITH